MASKKTAEENQKEESRASRFPNLKDKLKTCSYALGRCIIYLFTWLLSSCILKVYTYYLRPPSEGTWQTIAFSGAANDAYVYTLILIIPILIIWILYAIGITTKHGSLAIEKVWFFATTATVFTVGVINAIYISWAEIPMDIYQLGNFLEAKELWYSGENIIKAMPILIGLSLLLAYLLIKCASIYRPKKLPTLMMAGLIIAIVLIANQEERLEENQHLEAIRTNVIENSYKVVSQDKYGEGKGEDAKKVTAKSIRQALVKDGGVYTFLDEKYPLAKFNKTFRNKKRKSFAKSLELEKKKPNIVILFIEGLRAWELTAYGGEQPKLTPNLNALAKKSLLWENFVSNSVVTWRGTLSALSGVHAPNYGYKAELAMVDPKFPARGIGSMLKELGYKTEYYHNGPLSYANKVDFYGKLGYDTILGYEQLNKDNMYTRFGWGFGDEHLFEILSNRLNKGDKKPLHIAAITVGTHHPFVLAYPIKRAPSYNGRNSSFRDRYENCLHYADRFVGEFFKSLKPEVLNNTIFFILGDHSVPLGDYKRPPSFYSYLYEDQLITPLMIYAPGFIKKPEVIKDVGSHVDIPATIADIVNYSGPNHIIGNSLLNERNPKNNIAYFSNTYNWFGIRLNNYKYSYNKNKKQERLYQVEKDRKEEKDLSQSENFITKGIAPELKAQMLSVSAIWNKKSGFSLWEKNEAKPNDTNVDLESLRKPIFRNPALVNPKNNNTNNNKPTEEKEVKTPSIDEKFIKAQENLEIINKLNK